MKGLELCTVFTVSIHTFSIVTVFLDDIKFSLILRRVEKKSAFSRNLFPRINHFRFQTADEENVFFLFCPENPIISWINFSTKLTFVCLAVTNVANFNRNVTIGIFCFFWSATPLQESSIYMLKDQKAYN